MQLAENPRQGMTTEAKMVIRILLISDHVNRQENTQTQTKMRIIYICFLQKQILLTKQKIQDHCSSKPVDGYPHGLFDFSIKQVTVEAAFHLNST
ncbi:hypothetical protein SE958_21695 [Escherichia coli]|nr:hypothetical protein [Escherichia coli]